MSQTESKITMKTQRRTNLNMPGVQSISTLKAPKVRIEDHKSEVLGCEFHPSGKYILSCNSDGQIHICDIYGAFPKMMILEGHTEAVLETHFSRDGFDVYSCSADGTVAVWDTFVGTRKSKFEGHTEGVNCVQGTKMGYPLLCSGSDDGAVKIWDVREQNSALTFESTRDRTVTASSFSEAGDYIFSGGSDGAIEIWDLRKKRILYVLSGHKGKITGLSLSPCGSYLLSHSTDNTIRIWDVLPYSAFNRGIRSFPSNQEGANNLSRCNWSPSGQMISAGTTECDVFVWDSDSGEVVHSISGHSNIINDVAFHPKESILLSASNDNYMFLHEIKNFY